MKATLALALILIGGATPGLAARPVETGVHLIDLTGPFERVWQQTADAAEDKRAADFESKFAKILPGFYNSKRLSGFINDADYQKMVLKGLQGYPQRRTGIRDVSRQFAKLIGPAQRSFERAFGPMRGYPPVYLVVSFGEFDGATRDLPEGERLLFGADVIDKAYKNKPIQPFFHHELFHLLNHRHFDECAQIWCSLWSEGLAVYVASRLNPKADDGALLLAYPKSLRAAVDGHRIEAICAVYARLDSKSSEDYRPLFMGGVDPLSVNLPPRFGYYVGYLVAQDLGRTHSLKQLALLNNAQIRPLVEESLGHLASCPRPAA